MPSERVNDIFMLRMIARDLNDLTILLSIHRDHADKERFLKVICARVSEADVKLFRQNSALAAELLLADAVRVKKLFYRTANRLRAKQLIFNALPFIPTDVAEVISSYEPSPPMFKRLAALPSVQRYLRHSREAVAFVSELIYCTFNNLNLSNAYSHRLDCSRSV